jgi:hypothetical protein
MQAFLSAAPEVQIEQEADCCKNQREVEPITVEIHALSEEAAVFSIPPAIASPWFQKPTQHLYSPG